jgi:hypothetical protein
MRNLDVNKVEQRTSFLAAFQLDDFVLTPVLISTPAAQNEVVLIIRGHAE